MPRVRFQHEIRRYALGGIAALFPVLAFSVAHAEDKKPEEKKPTIILSSPLGLTAGASNAKVRVRGILLDEASEIKFHNTPVTGKITNKFKSGPPDKQKAERAGDTQVDLEITVPADAPTGEAKFTLVTPKGETPPYALLIGPAAELVEKKEPNGGFRESQPIELGKTVAGTIEQAKDVDVFRIHAAGGTKLAAEVIAARRGSAFDSLLTLYSSQGHILATSDDARAGPNGELSSDSLIEFTIPAEGDYFLALVDAQDTAGPAHVYRLRVLAK